MRKRLGDLQKKLSSKSLQDNLNKFSLSKTMSIEEIASQKKAIDIKILDLRKICFFTDFFVIMTGNSTPHVNAIREEILKKLKPYHEESDKDRSWILIDYGDVIVHIFKSEARKYYALERLWGDAKVLCFGTRHK